MAVIDSYGTGNRDSDYSVITSGTSTDDVRVGQSFTGDGSTLGDIQLYLSHPAFGTKTTDTMYVKVFAHSGTFGTSSLPTGSALATSDGVDPSVLSTSPALVTFPFSGGNQITLTNGTNFVLTFEGGTFDFGGAVLVGYDASSPSHGGNVVRERNDGGGGPD